MAVERIKQLDIDNKPLFTGICGASATREYFVEADLLKYNLWQELYMYLRSMGYTVVLYNTQDNFFSYEQSQLEVFFGRNSQPTSTKEEDGKIADETIKESTHRFRCKGPFGNVRPKEDRTNNQEPGTQEPSDVQPQQDSSKWGGLKSHDPGFIKEGGSNYSMGYFYQVKKNEQVMDQITRFVDTHKDHKLAVIFTNPETTSFSEKDVDVWTTGLQNRFVSQSYSGIPLKIIAIYNAQTPEALLDAFSTNSSRFFYSTFFKNQLFPTAGNQQIQQDTPVEPLFTLGRIGLDEIKNVLNRKRIIEGVEGTYSPIPFDMVALRLWQDFPKRDKDGNVMKDYNGQDIKIDTVYEMDSLTKEELEQSLRNLDTAKARDRLDKLMGIDGIKKQFEEYLEDLRYAKTHDIKFRPHMVFLGNPGTGKTTVARIFADILREEGVLPTGQLVTCTCGDLIGEYVGSTRPKTQAVCNSARGGVLFVDEAYGLYQSENGHGTASFGEEAIEVLIQFMENNNDSLVILAGYKDQMNDMLNNGNAGLQSRIADLGRFNFEDYKPDVLYKIGLSKLKGHETTPEFQSALQQIFAYLYDHRDEDTWGNARNVENYMQKIFMGFVRRGKEHPELENAPIDVDCIPEEYMKYISAKSKMSDEDIMSQLNEMIGLQSVKDSINAIVKNVRLQRLFMEKGITAGQQPPQLNFMFLGNPGTGKTSVARLLGNIFASYGILPHSDVHEYSKKDVVSGIQGETIKNVDEMFKKSIGGVLFIDEAYTLAENDGQEALHQIVANMTLPRYQNKLCIVMAGYPAKMRQLISVNEGMQRRFGNGIITFDDYSNKELWEIFQLKVRKSGYHMDAQACLPYVMMWFASIPRDQNFGNAGLCDILIDQIKPRYTERILNESMNNPDLDAETLMTYVPQDFPNYEEIDINTVEQKLQELFSQASTDKRNKIVMDCTGNLHERRVNSIADLKQATGLLKSSAGSGSAWVTVLPSESPSVGGMIVTCSHVIEGAMTFEFSMYNGQFKTGAHLLWNNRELDMAVLQVDSLPDDARYFEIENNLSTPTPELTDIVVCGYPMGDAVSSSLSVFEGKISSYEKDKPLNDRMFDAYLSDINATHGNSGGPVMRKRDMKVIGLLQGAISVSGFEQRIISDVHQLYAYIQIIQ